MYPSAIERRLNSLREQADDTADYKGRDASFVCGSYVEFSIGIDSAAKTVTSCVYRTNGCGFMIAAADVAADAINGKRLADLHGLDEQTLSASIFDILGDFPAGRIRCSHTCVDAVRSAFAEYRARRIEEFRGEKALICTCFGVTEETIENIVAKNPNITVEKIACDHRAGSGCGSCRMLIQEIIDCRL